jgi:type IV pilus assembly protein PilP
MPLTVINRKPLKTALCFTAALVLGGCGEPDIQDLQQFVAATKAASPGKKPEPLPEIEPYRPFEYTAQGEKDPFALSAFAKKPDPYDPIQLATIKGTVHPNPNRPREELERYALGSLRMVGTFTNDQMGVLWALIEAPDGIIHRVQTGNFIGSDYGKILNISEQKIDLREIIADDDVGWKEREAFLSLAE